MILTRFIRSEIYKLRFKLKNSHDTKSITNHKVKFNNNHAAINNLLQFIFLRICLKSSLSFSSHLLSGFLPVDCEDFDICSCYLFGPLPHLHSRSHSRILEESPLEAKELFGLCMLFVVLKLAASLLLRQSLQVSKMALFSKFAILTEPKLQSRLQTTTVELSSHGTCTF